MIPEKAAEISGSDAEGLGKDDDAGSWLNSSDEPEEIIDDEESISVISIVWPGM